MPDDLAELRRWAAEACGYNSHGSTLAWEESWRPDRNIAQAMEVVDVVLATGLTLQLYSPGCWKEYSAKQPLWLAIFADDPFGDGKISAEARHENRCLAILLACRKASEAMSEVKG